MEQGKINDVKLLAIDSDIPDEPHPIFGVLRQPWNYAYWESHLTVCFTPPDAGWADLVLVSSAFGQHHIAYLSTIGAPFHDLRDWLADIVEDRLPASMTIDEEGIFTRLSVLPYDENWLEFRALRPAWPKEQADGTWQDAPETDAERGIVCRVRKYEFLAEWRRRFADFISQDFRPEGWDARYWHDYLHNDERYSRWTDIRRLDFSMIDRWLESNRPRTVAIERIVCCSRTGAERVALDWAIENGISHGGQCSDGRWVNDGTGDTRYQLAELPSGQRRMTKANVRDCDATLIVSIKPDLSGRSLLARQFAQRMGKPWLHLHPSMEWRHALADWLARTPIRVLNVAGPGAFGDAQLATFTNEVLTLLPKGVMDE